MTADTKSIGTMQLAKQMRAKAIDKVGRRVLVSRLRDSGQEVDLRLPVICDGYGRIRHFEISTTDGWPSNPLPIVPACRALGVDVPVESMEAVVFQNAACAWRCWYCFVPYGLLNADESRSKWFTADDLVALYKQIPHAPTIIDLSGGSPDLVPEWVPWMMQALRDANLDQSTYLWTDDNLSTTYLCDQLTSSERDLLCGYRNYGRVCCIKGFDARSFAFNTRAPQSDYNRQFEILDSVIQLGLDVYGYVTLTSPHDDGVESGVSDLLDRLQAIDEHFPLRVVPLRIETFTPVRQRLEQSGKSMTTQYQRSFAIQERAVAAWQLEIERRFDLGLRGRSIAEVPIRATS